MSIGAPRPATIRATELQFDYSSRFLAAAGLKPAGGTACRTIAPIEEEK
jgi:hypothetical protein